MKFPGPYSENRTAVEIENANHNDVTIQVSPLPSNFCRSQRGRMIVVRTAAKEKVRFDNHPCVRSTEFSETVWLCDHAGRLKDADEATHIATEAGTRLAAMLFR